MSHTFFRKTSILALAGLFSLSTLVAQVSVRWEPEVKSALDKAKTQGKLLFVEAYLEDCPACQSIEPFFKNAEVAKKYNGSFVNFKLNLAKANQVKFLDDRSIRVPSYPQFLFFDGEGNLVHQSDDVLPPSGERLNNVANVALNPEQWSSNYKNRFDSGERDIQFLEKYGKYTRFIKDTVENYKVVNALFEVFPKNDISGIYSYIVTKNVVMDVDNGFFQHWIRHINVAADLEKNYGGKAGGEKNTLGGIISSALMSRYAKDFSLDKLAKIREYMRIAGVEQYADDALWEKECRAMIMAGWLNDALLKGKITGERYTKNGQALIYLTKVFNENFPDTTYTAQAFLWLKNAKPLLKENAYLAEYHYESARLNQRLGKTVEAKKNSAEAFKYAKLAKADTKKFEALAETL